MGCVTSAMEVDDVDHRGVEREGAYCVALSSMVSVIFFLSAAVPLDYLIALA
jgi:hypothetical protein